MQRHVQTTVLAICLIGSVAHAAAADEHAAIPAPAVTVGDSWSYQYTDIWKHLPGNLNRTEVTAVTDTGIQVEVKRAASSALVARSRYTGEMNPIDRGNMHFAPAFGRYAFPLAAGKEWSSDATAENPAAGRRWRYQVKGKALGWEKITVAAGEFDALKIVVEAYYTGEQVGTRGGSGHLTETIWFAPAVNNFVKMDYVDTDWEGRIFNRDKWELTAYTKK